MAEYKTMYIPTIRDICTWANAPEMCTNQREEDTVSLKKFLETLWQKSLTRPWISRSKYVHSQKSEKAVLPHLIDAVHAFQHKRFHDYFLMIFFNTWHKRSRNNKYIIIGKKEREKANAQYQKFYLFTYHFTSTIYVSIICSSFFYARFLHRVTIIMIAGKATKKYNDNGNN